MGVRTFEGRVFGEPLTIPERVVAGVMVLAGVAGHVVLGLAVLVFLSVVFGVV
ncbi:MAG: hypothetical protein ABEJ73_00115 [Haloplanus sp.]